MSEPVPAYENEGRCPACGEYVINRNACAALDEHLENCRHCFRLSDGTPVRCSDALRLRGLADAR